MNNPRDWSSGLVVIGLQAVALLAAGALCGGVLLLLFWR